MLKYYREFQHLGKESYRKKVPLVISAVLSDSSKYGIIASAACLADLVRPEAIESTAVWADDEIFRMESPCSRSAFWAA
jgi:hypothetical protein